MIGLLGAIAVLAIGYGMVARLALRRPMLARLAIREATRRPGQSLLVVAGLAVATATITAGLVAADSTADSSVDQAYRNWGSTDLTITAGGAFFGADLPGRLAAVPGVAAGTDALAGGIDLVGTASDPRAGRSALVTVVGFDPREQRAFGSYRLTDGRSTDGSDLGPGQVLVSQLLASALDARRGDRIQVGVGSRADAAAATEALTVAGISREEGSGGYTLGAAVFAPLSTVRSLLGAGTGSRIGSSGGAADGINIIRVSAAGGIRNTDAKRATALAAVDAAVRGLSSRPPLAVRPAKSAEIVLDRQGGALFRVMLVGMSMLVLAVGAALIVSLSGMLAAERRRRWGVLRALGLRRAGLIGLAVTEGAIYSVLSGVLGIVAGLYFGRIVADRFAEVFAAYAGPEADASFRYSLHPTTLVTGFAAGTGLVLLTIWLAARRTSRLTVVAAIRDLPEPAPARAGRPRLRASLAGGLLAGAAALTVGLVSPDALGLFLALLVISVLAAVFGLTLLAIANLPLLERGLGLLGRPFARATAIGAPALAYASRRPVRTGLNAGIFAVVIAMLTVLAVLRVSDRTDYRAAVGGFDLRAESLGSLPAGLPEVSRLLPLGARQYLGPVLSREVFSGVERAREPLYAVTPQLAADPPFELAGRDPRFGSDRAVWQAVLNDPALVVSSLAAPGQQFTLIGRTGPITFTVAGTPGDSILPEGGGFLNQHALVAFSDFPLAATTLIRLADPAAAAVVASRLESSGVVALTTGQLRAAQFRADQSVPDVVAALMRIGLLVGTLGLGIVALRTGIERRNVIGILRAIGYRRRDVLLTLLTESLVVALVGTAVGVFAGLVLGYRLVKALIAGAAFGVDGAGLAGLIGLVLGAALAVTVPPAVQAARLPPAEAARYTE